MKRVTMAGPELARLETPQPAASVRLLLPTDGRLVMPEWTGNEFLLSDGSRAPIRTFTPRRFDADALEMDIDIVLHDGGAASAWIERAGEGDEVAISGPARGYEIDPVADSFFLAGDETALPAIGQLLEEIPEAAEVRAVIEIRHPDARIELPHHPGTTVLWAERPHPQEPGSALIPAVLEADISPGTKVWVAGEAGSLVPIRTHLRANHDRQDLTIRGYWKHGR